MSAPNKKPGKLKSRLAAFENTKHTTQSERSIEDMLSPMGQPKRGLGKKAASDFFLASPSAVRLENDKKTILANREGSVNEFVSKFNLQESMNEEYFAALLEDKALRRQRCRTQAKKRVKKKAPDPTKQVLQEKKTSNAAKKVITSTASVWKNRKASTSITVDPTTYRAPNNMNKSKTENTAETRQLIETAIDEGGALFADPTKNGTKNSPENRQQLVDAFESIQVDAGTIIVEEKDDDHFYVVQEGQVDIQVNGVTVRTADKGDTFGELNLLYNRTDEKAVVVASSSTDATKLLRLNQKDYREIVQVQTKQEEEEKRELLKKIPFLKKLLFGEEKKNDEIIRRLCSIMQPNLLQVGTPLAEDDAADTLYVVKKGNIQLTSATNDNFMLAPGDYIGKKPMMGTGKEPTVKSLEAHQTDGVVYSIKKSNVEKVLGKNFFSRHASRMQDRAKLEKFDCIASAELDAKTMEIMAESVVDVTFEAGKAIFKQGDKVEPCLYMVREGSVILSTDDGKFKQEVGPGGYFGVEQLLVPGQDKKGNKTLEKVLLPAEWNVTVSDKTACVCGVLDLAECQAILDNQGEKPPKKEVIDTKTPAMKKREEARRSFTEKPFNLDELEMLSVLGDGEFGEVWLVSAEVFGKKEKFALKVQDKKDADVASVKREIAATKAFHHPFIVNLVTSYETDDSIYMLLGLVSGGELWDVIHVEDEDGNWVSGLQEPQAKFYALLIADTLAYIHNKQYVYRDLKPENVMIDKDGYPILVDFGFAKMITDKTYTCCGTPNYVAPEIIWNTGHNGGVDLWALGVLCYEMVSGEHPFFSDEMDQMALYHGITEEDHYALPDHVSQNAVSLIDGLLTKEPSQRLGMLANKEKDVIGHPWFSDLDLEKLRARKVKAPYIPPSK